MPNDDPQDPQGATPSAEELQKQLAAALAEAEKWKGFSRTHEDRAKANADKAKRFDEIEDKNKSEVQKLTEERDAALKQIADRDALAERSKLVEAVAKEKGVPANALRGSSREELEEHADILKGLTPAPPAAPSADGQGEQGKPITEGDSSAKDIVDAATTR